jgi:hypothetical protein
MNVRDNLASGKYENRVSYSIERVPVDEQNMTVAQAKTHTESEKERNRAQHRAHMAEEGRLTQLLKNDLEVEHNLVGHPMADKLWAKAWQHGHSSGYYDVVNYYEDFMELLEPRAA